MVFLAAKAAFFAVLLVVAVLTVWLSTPWGYRKRLYTRLIRRDSPFDNPQLLRMLGLAGALYAVLGAVNTGLHMVEERDRQLRASTSLHQKAPAPSSVHLSLAGQIER